MEQSEEHLKELQTENVDLLHRLKGCVPQVTALCVCADLDLCLCIAASSRAWSGWRDWSWTTWSWRQQVSHVCELTRSLLCTAHVRPLLRVCLPAVQEGRTRCTELTQNVEKLVSRQQSYASLCRYGMFHSPSPNPTLSSLTPPLPPPLPNPTLSSLTPPLPSPLPNPHRSMSSSP